MGWRVIRALHGIGWGEGSMGDDCTAVLDLHFVHSARTVSRYPILKQHCDLLCCIAEMWKRLEFVEMVFSSMVYNFGSLGVVIHMKQQHLFPKSITIPRFFLRNLDASGKTRYVGTFGS